MKIKNKKMQQAEGGSMQGLSLVRIIMCIVIVAAVIGVIALINLTKHKEDTPEQRVAKGVSHLSQNLTEQQDKFTEKDVFSNLMTAYSENGSQTDLDLHISVNETEGIPLDLKGTFLLDPIAKQSATDLTVGVMGMELASLNTVLDQDNFYISSKEFFEGSIFLNLKEYAEMVAVGGSVSSEMLDQSWKNVAWDESKSDMDLEAILDLENRFRISATDTQREWTLANDTVVNTEEFLLELKEPYEMEKTGIQVEKVYLYLDSENHIIGLSCPVSQNGEEISNAEMQFLGTENPWDEVMIATEPLNGYTGGAFMIAYKNEVTDEAQEVSLQINGETESDFLFTDVNLQFDRALNEYTITASSSSMESDIILESDGCIRMDEENKTCSIDIYNTDVTFNGLCMNVSGEFSISEKTDTILVPEGTLDIVNASEEEMNALAEEVYGNLMELLGNSSFGELMY